MHRVDIQTAHNFLILLNWFTFSWTLWLGFGHRFVYVVECLDGKICDSWVSRIIPVEWLVTDDRSVYIGQCTVDSFVPSSDSGTACSGFIPPGHGTDGSNETPPDLSVPPGEVKAPGGGCGCMKGPATDQPTDQPTDQLTDQPSSIPTGAPLCHHSQCGLQSCTLPTFHFALVIPFAFYLHAIQQCILQLFSF